MKAVKLLAFLSVFVLSGCVVRTYELVKDRVDQDLSEGNRGYVGGETPAIETVERKPTRTTYVTEIELHSPIKFEKAPKTKISAPSVTAQPTVEQAELTDESLDENLVQGNRGYITRGLIPESSLKVLNRKISPAFEQYTVKKYDTLQKISKHFYGRTRDWVKIYQANKDKLKGPDKIYVGQVLNIPIEEAVEIKGNLK